MHIVVTDFHVLLFLLSSFGVVKRQRSLSTKRLASCNYSRNPVLVLKARVIIVCLKLLKEIQSGAAAAQWGQAAA